MKVYIVETGAYENRGVSGVYVSVDAAIAAHPIPADFNYPKVPTAGDMSVPGGWRQLEDGRWDNGLDWDFGASITEYDVEG